MNPRALIGGEPIAVAYAADGEGSLSLDHQRNKILDDTACCCNGSAYGDRKRPSILPSPKLPFVVERAHYRRIKHDIPRVPRIGDGWFRSIRLGERAKPEEVDRLLHRKSRGHCHGSFFPLARDPRIVFETAPTSVGGSAASSIDAIVEDNPGARKGRPDLTEIERRITASPPGRRGCSPRARSARGYSSTADIWANILSPIIRLVPHRTEAGGREQQTGFSSPRLSPSA